MAIPRISLPDKFNRIDDLVAVSVSPSIMVKPPSHYLAISREAEGGFRPSLQDTAKVHLVPELTISYRHGPRRGGQWLSSGGILPGNYQAIVNRIDGEFARARPDLERLSLDEPAYVPFTPKYHEYGHFLLECVPKLLFVRAMVDQGFDFPIITPSALPAWISDFLTLIFARDRLVEVDELHQEMTVRIGVVPSGLATGYSFHPLLNELIKLLPAHLVEPDEHSPSQVFVRRQLFRRNNAKDFRCLENESEIALLLSSCGYTCVEPQTMPITEQIRLFRGTSHVVGEASSAMHTLMFSSQPCSVLSLNWINHMQTAIAGLHEQTLDYLRPEDGRFRNWDTIHDVSPNFRIASSQMEPWLNAASKLDRPSVNPLRRTLGAAAAALESHAH